MIVQTSDADAAGRFDWAWFQLAGVVPATTSVAAPSADESAPTLTSLSFTPRVNVTNGGRTMAFAVEASDVGLGVESVSIAFNKSWQGGYGADNYVFLGQSWGDGFDDGASNASEFIDATSGAGSYEIAHLIVRDKAGNSRLYYAQELAGLGFQTLFDIVDLNWDGSADADTLIGTDDEDVMRGLDGNDRLVALAGSDRLDGGHGRDRLEGGAGDDIYAVDNARDRITEAADEGTDTVEASLDWSLGANVENLVLTGAAISGKGNDLANTLTGNGATNRLDGRQGDDVLVGGGGDDLLIGRSGDDRMVGGAGDDDYRVDEAGDVVVELAGEGFDKVQASIDYVLPDHVERLTLIGRARVGTGNASDNVIVGSSGADTLAGLGGDDTIQGNEGGDRIDGGAGDDTLSGGAGRDLLTGGSGADRFTFRPGDTGTTAADADRILDFARAEGDRISLSAIDAVAGTPGDDRFAFIGTAAFGGVAGQLRYAFYGGDTLIEGDVDGDGVADLAVRLSGNVALGAGDFVL